MDFVVLDDQFKDFLPPNASCVKSYQKKEPTVSEKEQARRKTVVVLLI